MRRIVTTLAALTLAVLGLAAPATADEPSTSKGIDWSTGIDW